MVIKSKAAPLDAEALVEALHYMHGFEKGWYFFTEVETPFIYGDNGSTRRVDALAIGRYAAKRDTWIGYEIKVSRADFLGELKSEKYLDWEKYCHEFWFVCPMGMVETSEIPDGIGLLEVKRHGRGYIRQPTVRPANRAIGELPIGIVSNLLARNHHENWNLRWKVGSLKDEIRSLLNYIRNYYDLLQRIKMPSRKTRIRIYSIGHLISTAEDEVRRKN